MILTTLPYMGDTTKKELDLVDQMIWEDNEEFITLEAAGLELKDIDTIPAILNQHYFRGEQ